LHHRLSSGSGAPGEQPRFLNLRCLVAREMSLVVRHAS
jgi:hypothetical protein